MHMSLDKAVKTSRTLKSGEKSIKELRAITDDDIDYSDAPELTDKFRRNAKLQPLKGNIPNEETLKAIDGVRNQKRLKKHKDLDSFMSSLEL